MVKTEIFRASEGVNVQMKGNVFAVMAEEMMCIEEFYRCLKSENEGYAETFRAGVEHWAKGGFDD